MPAITAQQIMDENNWADFNKTYLEYLIDNIINYINGETGLSISNLSGVAASKTVTVTSAQDPVIKAGVALAVRAYKDKDSGAVANVNIQAVVSDPHYRFMSMLFKSGVKRLRGRSFERT